jgi:hypothetical protein
MSELRKSKYAAAPSSGARRPAGKHSDRPDANLLFGDKKKPEEVKTLPVESDNQDHYKCMEAQNNGNVLVISNSREESIAAGRAAINKRAVGGKK